MEYRVSKASTVSIITAFIRHQLSIDIFSSLLSMKYDIKIQNAAIKNPFKKILKSYILSRGLSGFGRKTSFFFFFLVRFVSRSDMPKFQKWFSRLLCKDYQGKLTTLLEPLHTRSLFLSAVSSVLYSRGFFGRTFCPLMAIRALGPGSSRLGAIVAGPSLPNGRQALLWRGDISPMSSMVRDYCGHVFHGEGGVIVSTSCMVRCIAVMSSMARGGVIVSTSCMARCIAVMSKSPDE